ncbi:poly-gamma-glutamate synthesis protein (capsule biosynthesis protein) [Butyrivibrio sp. ob235]|uniref:CapA family protein n=1 Tax=Butyrivibrio sp. ob235 TaxID=1761780 RepID=UPI0008D7B245|nr:CapA family protein [Butyrivibrio sp. ob235]SEK63703.1 poly-gamma-glutamate synthesis protein (capsule biosynthesis protein) [Butyrivibrio sp. ob235]
MNTRIAFLGDIAVFDHGLLQKDWKKILYDVHAYLAGYDVVVANLETPITDNTNTRVIKGIHLRTDKRIVEVLKYLHITHVNLGNNHIYDFGEKGVADTVDVLRENGIHYFGIGTMPSYLDLDRNISFHSFCCYSANGGGYGKVGGEIPLTEEAINKALTEDSNNDRLSVLCLHWGDEYSCYPNARQVDLFHRIAKQYRVFIHGSHTHVIQGIEEVRNSMCIYSAGNFLMDRCISAKDKSIQISQIEDNKFSFIVSLMISDKSINDYTTVGTYYDGIRFDLVDNSERIKRLSNEIHNCHNKEYILKSRNMANKMKRQNLGKRDIKWLLQKMNYNSLFAKIFSYINRWKYMRAY